MTFPLTKSTTFDEALAYIANEPSIWVRFGAVRDDANCWHARTVELTGGDAPPSWEESVWEYPDALFATLKLSGGGTTQFLREQALRYGDYELELPPTLTTVQWERRQSWSRAPFETLEWPSVEATISISMGAVNTPWGHQVSAGGAPSFVTFDAAAAAFFGIELQSTNMPVVQGVVFRCQDLRGRIDGVRVRKETLDVVVDGNDLGELEVELAGDTPGRSQLTEKKNGVATEPVHFELANGLPSGAWVLLRKGSEWIDRRFLSVPYATGQQAGVEIVIEAGTKLEVLVAGRERQYVEFKRQVPSADESKRKVMKTVSAFANGSGGSILIGVDDDRNLLGIDPREVERLRDQVTQMIGSWVEPWPPIEFDILPMSDSEKVVLEVQISSGSSLYGCGRPGEIRIPYVRHFGVTEKASVIEIEKIVRSRTPQMSGLSILQ
jgi:hypothetical protein